jgi:hypothetical protein
VPDDMRRPLAGSPSDEVLFPTPRSQVCDCLLARPSRFANDSFLVTRDVMELRNTCGEVEALIELQGQSNTAIGTLSLIAFRRGLRAAAPHDLALGSDRLRWCAASRPEGQERDQSTHPLLGDERRRCADCSVRQAVRLRL